MRGPSIGMQLNNLSDIDVWCDHHASSAGSTYLSSKSVSKKMMPSWFQALEPKQPEIDFGEDIP